MAIVAITGLPGHGKTLYALWRFKAEAEKDARPVYHNGIKDLNIPGWKECNVEDWQSLPPRSIIVIDEAQFVFPVRGRDRPPPFIEQLATHRHLGVDFVLITQDPMLIDSFVRRLVDRHFHVMRRFGTQVAKVHEFTSGIRDNVAKNRSGSIEHTWFYPKEVFAWYKSAEVHTVKRRIPPRVFLLAVIPFVFLALAIVLWKRMQPEAQAARVSQVVGKDPAHLADAQPARSSPGGGDHVSASPVEYFAGHVPRIEGLPHTAPRFDELTKPVRAPLPMACVASKTRCSCYTQQSTRLQMPEHLCRTIVADGFFVDFDDVDSQARRDREASQHAQPQQAVQRVDQAPSTGWQSVTAASLAR